MIYATHACMLIGCRLVLPIRCHARVQVKGTLIDEFGEPIWIECREEVRTLLEQLMDPLSPVPGRGNPHMSSELIMERATLLAAASMPYNKVRTALIEEFTEEIWERAKTKIKLLIKQRVADSEPKIPRKPSRSFPSAQEAREFAFKCIKDAYLGAAKPPTYLSIKDRLEKEIGVEYWAVIRTDIEHLLRVICRADQPLPPVAPMLPATVEE